MPSNKAAASVALEILPNIIKCEFIFYSTYYLVATICHGAYGLGVFNPRTPFDFNTWVDVGKCCDFVTQAKINLLSMVCSFAFLLLLLVFWIRKGHWIYVLISTILHVLLSAAVMQGFPITLSYWMSICVSAFVCLAVADIIVFFVNEPVYNPRAAKKHASMT